MSTTTPTALQIPGTVTATFNPDGSLASIDFTPSASAAGYFGSHFIDEETGEGYRVASRRGVVADEADFVSETWAAIAEYLGNNDGKIGWTE